MFCAPVSLLWSEEWKSELDPVRFTDGVFLLSLTRLHSLLITTDYSRTTLLSVQTADLFRFSFFPTHPVTAFPNCVMSQGGVVPNMVMSAKHLFYKQAELKGWQNKSNWVHVNMNHGWLWLKQEPLTCRCSTFTASNLLFKRFVKLLQLYLLRWISPPYPTHNRWFTFTDSQSDVTRSVQHSAAIEISNLSSATWWFPKVWFGTVCWAAPSAQTWSACSGLIVTAVLLRVVQLSP